MKDKIFGVLQRVGRSFMLPIAMLPIAGLLLGIGSSFTNQTTLEAYHLAGIIRQGGILYGVLTIMKAAGSVVFDNLALLFAMGVAIGMAKKEKAVAALSGAVGYLIMNTAISALIEIKGGVSAMAANSTTRVLGITTLQMGVFGGIIVGLGVAALHNRYYKIELPQVLSFFGGTRFVPIVTAVVYLMVGIAMFFIWPVVQSGISYLGNLVLGSGYVGTFLYGLIERALIPFGLHHVFYMPFWQTDLGGTMLIDGNVVSGAQNIFFAELASGDIEHFSASATRFMTGKFPFMIFGLPAAAYAMYKAARPEKKKQVGGLLLSAALTSMITGITEPLEFTFLFVAPAMYAVHCLLAGLSYMLMHLLNVTVGMTFSGGAIDLTLFGILQGNSKTNWVGIILVGLFYAVIYYFVFYSMIQKFDFKTPGRGEEEETKLYTRKDLEARKNHEKNDDVSGSGDLVSALILKGLGGKENLSDLDCCATRLRVTVLDSDLVSDNLLKQSGASGVIHKGNGVQVIYGPQVSVIKSNLEDFMESGDADRLEEILRTRDEKPQEEHQKDQQDKHTEPVSIELCAHMNGTVIPLEEVEDEAFSRKILGDGAAIEPKDGRLYAPCDGRVEMVFDTKHAINLVSDEGCEILLHIGIDTVKLGGKYFEVHVSDGQKIHKGDLLISFDLEGIRNEGYQTTTPFIICNTEDYSSINSVRNGEVSAGELLMKLF
ncbi:MAG: glucose PTS transporter subunit IIA [Lachnospiraceae bacterium]|nr:glucose PTS transporter subunit IIA [Lachnospiraceae bacterium]